MFSNCCRLCLNGDTVPEIPIVQELSKIINQLFDIKIDEIGILYYICNNCFQQVTGFSAFSQKVKRNQEIIKKFQIIENKINSNKECDQIDLTTDENNFNSDTNENSNQSSCIYTIEDDDDDLLEEGNFTPLDINKETTKTITNNTKKKKTIKKRKQMDKQTKINNKPDELKDNHNTEVPLHLNEVIVTSKEDLMQSYGKRRKSFFGIYTH